MRWIGVAIRFASLRSTHQWSPAQSGIGAWIGEASLREIQAARGTCPLACRTVAPAPSHVGPWHLPPLPTCEAYRAVCQATIDKPPYLSVCQATIDKEDPSMEAQTACPEPAPKQVRMMESFSS